MLGLRENEEEGAALTAPSEMSELPNSPRIVRITVAPPDQKEIPVTTQQTHPRSLPDPRETPTLSIGRTAAILGVSTGTVYEAVRRHELRSIRVRSRVVIPTAYLVDMLTGGFE